MSLVAVPRTGTFADCGLTSESVNDNFYSGEGSPYRYLYDTYKIDFEDAGYDVPVIITEIEASFTPAADNVGRWDGDTPFGYPEPTGAPVLHTGPYGDELLRAYTVEIKIYPNGRSSKIKFFHISDFSSSLILAAYFDSADLSVGLNRIYVGVRGLSYETPCPSGDLVSQVSLDLPPGETYFWRNFRLTREIPTE